MCQSLFFNKVAGAEALVQVVLCELCKILRTPFFYRTPPVAASDFSKILLSGHDKMILCLVNLRENGDAQCVLFALKIFMRALYFLKLEKSLT